MYIALVGPYIIETPTSRATYGLSDLDVSNLNWTFYTSAEWLVDVSADRRTCVGSLGL